jgi:hypothetical protein
MDYSFEISEIILVNLDEIYITYLNNVGGEVFFENFQ